MLGRKQPAPAGLYSSNAVGAIGCAGLALRLRALEAQWFQWRNHQSAYKIAPPATSRRGIIHRMRVAATAEVLNSAENAACYHGFGSSVSFLVLDVFRTY